MNTSLLNHRIVGVDIGGSHITAATITPEQIPIEVKKKIRKFVNAKGDKNSILETWSEVLKQFVSDKNQQIIKVAIAMPGPFDYEKGISLIKELHKYDALYGIDVRKVLSEKTGIPTKNILFRNDAEAFLHGEIVFNTISQEIKTIGITLGTGLGSAVSIGGKTKDVFRAVHPMHESIAEEYISTRWFQKRFKELTGRFLPDVKTILKEPNTIKDQIFSEFGKNLGLFLHDFITEENAKMVIIGGNIARCFNYFKEEMLQQVHGLDLEVKQSVLWEDAALIGAACSFPGAEKMALTGHKNNVDKHS